MSYCLNPNCQKPLNSEETISCHSCGKKLQPLLRNRYRIIRPLGGGGFGRTFLAEDKDKLNELCVVKQLVPQIQGTKARQKATLLFQQEARRLQQLGEHPQIPTLYAYFEQDGYLYLVQQLIVGQTLQQELGQQGIFDELKIWQLLSDLLPVLQYIHTQHVIHRDIKLENIIRRSPQPSLPTKANGNLVLIDFGVAKYLTTTAIAQPGTSIGSFGYAALEQMSWGEAYPATDLYSLGVACFHLLTQIHPSQLWAEQGYSWVTNWRQYLRSPISQKLTQVLDKLLQKDLHQRYQFANEVLQDIDPQAQLLIPHLAAVTQPPNTIENSHYPDCSDKATNFFPPGQQKPHTELKERYSFSNKLLSLGAILLLSLAGYWYWLSLESIPTLTGHTGEVNSVAFSPDGEKIASGSDDRTVKIWSLNRQQELRTIKGHLDWIYSVAIGSDSKTLISGSKDKTIKVWDLNTGKEIRTQPVH